MNIIILTHSYPDFNQKWRGNFVQEQARVLSLIHNITVVYFKVDYSHFSPFSGYSFRERTDGNIKVYEVVTKRSFPVITQLKYLSDTYRFINNEILSRTKTDLIHCHLSYPAGFLGAIIKKRKKIPVFITEHSRIKMYFRSWLHKKSVIYGLNNSDCVIAVSNPLKEEISAYTQQFVNVVYNIVNTDKFELVKAKSGTLLNIGFLGSMNNRNKGLDILLKSALQIKTREFMLHIGGNGSLIDEYRELAKNLEIEDHCKFYGEIYPEDVQGFYSRLDLFVLSSRYETFGIVLIEAMACGLPVIATKCGGPQEIVSESTGILIEKDNPEALAGAINFISANTGKYNKDIIRRYAEDKFGRKAFIDNISSLYSQKLKLKS